jgi:hypothetical protein
MVVATSPFEECFQFVVWFVVGSEILEAGFLPFFSSENDFWENGNSKSKTFK